MVRILHVVMAALFAWSVYLQHNDPDPIPWMALYGTALALSLAAAAGARLRWQPATLALLAFAWSMVESPAFPKWLENKDKTTFYMHTGDDVEEDARETGGLWIVTFWSLVILVEARADRRRT